MTQIDKRIDAYISRSGDFAKPILTHIRALVHKACPNVEETIKWGFPHFDYKGMFCSMASFKSHCAFGFWKAALMKDKILMDNAKAETAMGHLGKIQSLADLPTDKTLIQWMKEAMQLNEDGVKLAAKPKTVAAPVEAPADLMAALRKNKAALATFTGFTNGNKKEYITWVLEAKTEDTRNKRIATAVEWMAEGKIRNWKYAKK